jgi:hypothetical protein
MAFPWLSLSFHMAFNQAPLWFSSGFSLSSGFWLSSGFPLAILILFYGYPNACLSLDFLFEAST